MTQSGEGAVSRVALGFGLNSVWLSMFVDTSIRAVLNLRRFNATLVPAAAPGMTA